MKNTVAFLVMASLVTFGWWLGGFDFNNRGEEFVGWYLLTLAGGCFGILLVNTHKKNE